MIQRIAFVYLVALSFALASCAGDIGLADKANSNGTPLLTNPGDGDVELPPGDDGEDPAGEPGGEPNAGGGDPGEQITRDPTRDREYRGPRNAPPTKYTEPGAGEVPIDWTRCGNRNQKYLVCKVPPGNPSNEHNICVSGCSVRSHLAMGSYPGPCGSEYR